MQQQSDKEFDKVFQEKFESFECEPSDIVWTAISDKLDKKKKAFPRFWMAAASIVLVLGAGIWLMKPKETIRLHGSEEITENHPATEINRVLPKKQEEIEEPVLPEALESALSSYVPEKSIHYSAKTEIEKPKKENIQTKKPDAEDNSTLTAVKIPAVNDETQPVQSEVSTISLDTSTAVLAAIPETETHTEKPTASIRDIKTVGGLVNFVVEKVDKRKQKLIEFTDTDEGSFVSGINLGFVKFKNKNNN